MYVFELRKNKFVYRLSIKLTMFPQNPRSVTGEANLPENTFKRNFGSTKFSKNLVYAIDQ